MSYLLRTNRKKGLSTNVQPRIVQRSTPVRSTGSGEGGLVQIQRHSQQKSVSTANAQKENTATQQGIQGGISMQEVLADLRILEKQQIESARKLRCARTMKQRRMEQQSALEAKLDKLKYQNGQLRADMERAHKMLSEGQRKLQTARTASESAGEDLRDYDGKVKMALGIKRTLLAYQRKQDSSLEELYKKTDMLKRLAKEAEEQFEVAKREFNKAKVHEGKLRQGLRDELAQQQNTAKDTAEMREASAKYENQLSLAADMEKELELREERIKKFVIEERTRHTKCATDLNCQKDKNSLVNQQLGSKNASIQEAAASKKQELHEIWRRIIEFQKEEHHTLSPPPSESSTPPILDVKRVRESVQAEQKAVAIEIHAKQELLVSVEATRSRIMTLEVEKKGTSEKAASTASCATHDEQSEKERKVAIENLEADLKKVAKEIAEKSTLAQGRSSADEQVVSGIRNELDALSAAAGETEDKLLYYRQQVADVDEQLAAMKAVIEEEELSNKSKIADIEHQVDEARKKSQELQLDAKHLHKKHSQAVDKDGKRCPTEEDAKKDIGKMLEMYPKLEKVPLLYDENLEPSEQASNDLKDLLHECKLSINVAKKKLGRVKTKQVAKHKGASEKPHPSQHPEQKVSADPLAKAAEAASVAKPRALLDSFVRASQDQESIDGDPSPKGGKPIAKEDITQMKSAMTQETEQIDEQPALTKGKKKVHWGDAAIPKFASDMDLSQQFGNANSSQDEPEVSEYLGYSEEEATAEEKWRPAEPFNLSSEQSKRSSRPRINSLKPIPSLHADTRVETQNQVSTSSSTRHEKEAKRYQNISMPGSDEENEAPGEGGNCKKRVNDPSSRQSKDPKRSHSRSSKDERGRSKDRPADKTTRHSKEPNRSQSRVSMEERGRSKKRSADNKSSGQSKDPKRSNSRSSKDEHGRSKQCPADKPIGHSKVAKRSQSRVISRQSNDTKWSQSRESGEERGRSKKRLTDKTSGNSKEPKRSKSRVSKNKKSSELSARHSEKSKFSLSQNSTGEPGKSLKSLTDTSGHQSTGSKRSNVRSKNLTQTQSSAISSGAASSEKPLIDKSSRHSKNQKRPQIRDRKNQKSIQSSSKDQTIEPPAKNFNSHGTDQHSRHDENESDQMSGRGDHTDKHGSRASGQKSRKRSSEQTSGISTQERASKSRARKKSRSSSSVKPSLGNYEQDCDYNFRDE